MDQRLSWHNHIELVSERSKKLIWIFKLLRHVTSVHLIKQIYVALAQSIMTYCIPVWGGASKIKFLDVERAQRALLKTMFFKPYRFSSNELYKFCDFLTVRKLYILFCILKMHKTTEYDPTNLTKRRQYVSLSRKRVRTAFAKRQYLSQTTYLYNVVNRKLAICRKSYYECKKTLSLWLRTLTYDETEAVLHSII